MSDENNVVRVQFKQAYSIESELLEKLEDVLYSYAGKISVPSALGVVKLVELNLVANAYDND